MTKDFTAEQIQRQSVAAKGVIEALSDNGDGELNHDVVEGETDFFEAIERALGEIDEKQLIIDGCEAMIERLTKRKTQAKNRQENLRGLIDQAFHVAEIKTHVFPTATITTKKVPAKLIVIDEASIPAKYFKPQDPKLDRKALFDDIKNGVEVEGTTQSNGGSTIQIRKS